LKWTLELVIPGQQQKENNMKLRIVIKFPTSDQVIREFDSLVEGNHYMGVLQQGFTHKHKSYQLGEHGINFDQYDGVETVIVHCITQAEADKKLTDLLDQTSAGFRDKLTPPFKTDSGDGGGFLN